MPNFLAEIDFIALAIYPVYLCSILGGVWLLWRSSGRNRISGLVLLVVSIAATLLLTVMSSQYWFAGGTEIIALDIKALISKAANILLPLSLGIAIVVGAAYSTRKLSQGRWAAMASVLPVILILTIFSVSTTQLISLTEQSKPKLANPDPERDMKVVDGFSIAAFRQLPSQNLTSLIFGPDNNLYVATYNGDIWAISSTDGESWRYASGFQIPKALAWHDNALYVGSDGKISVARDTNGDNVVDETKDIITGLPAHIYHWHANNGIVFGNDGRMYFAVGSTTDSSPETHRYAASIISAKPDGSDLRTYAVGVRNPYRLAFNSQGDLFATENGPNELKFTPSDELNHIVEGGDYGFPKYFAIPPPNSGTIPPVALFPPHASADGLTVYQGHQFPSDFYDNAFVTLLQFGDVYRIQMTKDANGEYFARPSVFVSGLDSPVDITTGPDGSLYVADFNTGIIYKITYNGGK